jgi:RNA polymerase sigma-70 factor (ECF subfamily)
MQEAYMANDEAQIIYKAIAGEKQAFGLLYEKYSDAMLRYFFFRFASIEVAEDMTESVFIKAWEALPSFYLSGKELNFHAWLYRIAHNLLVDFLRSHKEETSIDAIGELPSMKSLPEKEIEQREFKTQLAKAINLLDGQSLQVVMNRFIAGLDHRETAKIMGISEGNVRVIQFRALKKLKEILGDSYE